MGQKMSAQMVLVGKSERRSLGRPRNRLEDKIEMYGGGV
jgi:hypothetical protein